MGEPTRTHADKDTSRTTTRSPPPKAALNPGHTPTARPADALSRWPELRAALTQEQAEQLGRGLQQRILRGGGLPEPKGAVLLEVDVPLLDLFKPSYCPSAPEGWQTRVLTESLQATDAKSLQRRVSEIVQPQLLAQWLAGNSSLLARSVRVAILDAAGTTPTLGGLVFQLGAHVLRTPDGSFYAHDLEAHAAVTLASLATAAKPELEQVATTAKNILLARDTLKVAEKIRGTAHSKVVKAHLGQARTLLEGQAGVLKKTTGATSTAARQEAATITTYLKDSWAPFEAAHAQWRLDNPDGKAAGESLLDSAIKDWEEGSYVWALGKAFGWGVGNMFSGDSLQASLGQHTAYRRGEVSFDQMSELTQAIERRGLIVGGITAVLTVASFGLGGVLARTSTLAGRVWVMGGYGAVAGAAPLAAGRIYTDLTPLSDPNNQAIWRASRPSWGSVALGGGLGFAIGGAFGYTSWLSQAGPKLQALAIASENGTSVSAPAGARVLSTRPGLVKVQMDGLPGHLEITRTGWRHMAPTGNSGQLVAVAEAQWSVQGAALGTRANPYAILDAGLAGNPAKIGVTGQGWMVGTPRGPVQYGIWDDLLLGAGTGQTQTGALALRSQLGFTSSPLALQAPLRLGGTALGSGLPLRLGGSSMGAGLPTGVVVPTVARPLAPAQLLAAYQPELLQRPDLVLHLDSIVARARAGGQLPGPTPATQSLQLEQVLLAIRRGASPQVVDTMVANIHNPMFSQGPGQALTRCMTNCGYVAISHGLKIQSPARFQLPEPLYQTTKAALSPSDSLPRTLLFGLPPGQSTHPPLAFKGLRDMSQYTLDAVAADHGLKLIRADLKTSLRPTYDHRTQARMIHRSIDRDPNWRDVFTEREVSTALSELKHSARGIQEPDLATLVPPLYPSVSAAPKGVAGHYIIGFENSQGMGHFMTARVLPNGQVIAYDNQIGRFFTNWLDLQSTYGSLPNYSRRIVTP